MAGLVDLSKETDKKAVSPWALDVSCPQGSPRASPVVWLYPSDAARGKHNLLLLFQVI